MDLSTPQLSAEAEGALVLRVLHGVHAGSEVLIEADLRAALAAAGLRIGSRLDNDVVLLDAPESGLSLRLHNGQLLWTGPEGNPRTTALDWANFNGVALGLFDPGAAWPNESAIRQRIKSESSAGDESPADAFPQASTPQAPGLAVPEAPGEPSMAGSPDQRPPPHAASLVVAGAGTLKPAFKGLWLSVGVGVLVVAGLLTLLAQAVPGPEAAKASAVRPTEQAPSLSGADLAAAQAALSATKAVLTQQGVASQTEAVMLPNGRVTVKAQSLDDESLERLATALSRLTPRPALEVSSEQDLLGAVRDALAQTDETLTAASIGPMQYRVEGRLPDAAARERLFAALKQKFPTQRFDNAVSIPPEIAAKLLADLRGQGLGEVTGQWDGQALQIKAKLARSMVPRWEQALASLAREAGAAVPLNASLQVVADPPVAAVSQPEFPFAVRSVVGGPSPYLVTSTGQKLLPGGSVGEWRLVSIDDTRITFEGPRRLVLPRQ